MLGRFKDDEIIEIPVESGGGGYAVPQGNTFQGRAELIDKIKPELMVEIIRHKLLGEEFINNRWVELKALKNRRLTQIGAWEISNLMLGVSSINISMSKLTDREIKERAYRIAKSAQILLISNWKEYGVHDIGQFYYVHEIVFSNTLAVLKQADMASIQELLKATIYENRNISTPQKEKTGNKISRMFGLSD
jgi:hypothetical protein